MGFPFTFTKARLEKLDYIGIATIWLLLIARCALLGNGVMWVDEFFSFNLIHDASTAHMISALGDQADGAPPLYYLAARAWVAVFSENPLMLRPFSTIGFCVGFSLLWATMRQAFAFLPTFLAL